MMLLANVFSFFPLLICSAILIFRYGRLRNVPGPFLGKLTDFWRACLQNLGGYHVKLSKIHEKYGSVVRLGPNNVSVSDASAVSKIYSLHGEYKKADSYGPMKGFLHGKVQGSIIDMQDEHLISALRRAIGSSFAVSNLLDYEEDVDITATALIDRMSTERNFELWTIMHQFQVDFFMKMAFSDDPVYLTTNKDPSVMSGQKRNYHWWQWQALPVLERLLYKNPYLSSTGASSHWVKLATQKLHARKMEKDSPRKIDLLDKFIIAGEKYSDTVDPALILKTVSSTIGAGLDTTPFTMTAIIYYLIRNPSAYESLQRELNDAVRDGKLSSPIPKYVEADLLPYLAAVIKEAMRCWPFLSISLERVVPQGGAEICGHHLPQGTVVGCHPWVVHHDQYVFGEDVDVFRPERWLEGGKETAYVMEKSTLGFGSGKRGCLGRHIAELEMKKVIPALLLNFEMRIDNQETKLESMDGLTPFPKPIFVTFMRKQ